MAYRIYCYDNNSKSGVMLKEALNGLFLKHKGSTFIPEKGDVVFNWGSSDDKPLKMLNSRVWLCIDKLKFFTHLTPLVGSHLPPYATTKTAAAKLGFPVVCRTKLQGCDGDGIVIANNEAELVEAKLYTKYIPKDGEYRVHVGKNKDGVYEVLLVQRKVKKSGSTNTNKQVRTTSNDYVFIHTGFSVPDAVKTAAIEVFKQTGMDFGGLDVIHTLSTGKAYVLEVNSAPELGKIACDAYVKFFEGFHTGLPEVHEKDSVVEATSAGQTVKSADNTAFASPAEGNNVDAGLGSVDGADVHKVPDSAGSSKPFGMVGHTGSTPGKNGAGVPGADISGLMEQLEHEFSKKVLHAYNEGLAKGKAQAPVVDVVAIQKKAHADGKIEGAAEFKLKMKELFA